MNTLTSQNFDIRENVCQIHQHEIIAIDLDSSENGSFKYLCCNCLVEKVNNNKISTIEQTQARIQLYKTQRQEKKKKEIQIKMDQFNELLKYFIEFKNNACNILDEIQNKLQTQIKTLKEQQPLLERCQISSNFEDDVKSLSEFLSMADNQMEFQQDSKFFDNIIGQIDLIFDNPAYSKYIQLLNVAKQKLKEFNEDNQIQLMPLQFENNKKPLSLRRLCEVHNKEITLIDIDSQNKQIEERFACQECLSDGPLCRYRSIEKINQLWNQEKNNQNQNFVQLKSKRLKKQEKLNQKLGQMRKNYNAGINFISQQLISEFPIPIANKSEISKFKQISIQQLSENDLLWNINYLIPKDERITQNEFWITKEIEFSKKIEIQLRQLKQNDLLDIQESFNILYDQPSDNQIQDIIQLSKQIQESSVVNEQKLIYKQELDDFISSSKQIYCQMELFNQTIEKINKIITKLKSITQHEDFSNLKKQLDACLINFKKYFKHLKDFFEIDELEGTILTLQQGQKEQQIFHQSEIQLLNEKIIDQNDLIKKQEQLLDKLGLNLKPTLLSDQYWIYLFVILQEKSKKTIKETELVFQGARDGLNNNSFWNKCHGKSNLIMIFQSQSGYIFGGYTPCKWQQNICNYVQDNTLSSFIFSQTHNQIYPLKQDRKQYAIYCDSGRGPYFGGNGDIYITSDFQGGHSRFGDSYQQEKCENSSTHLFGQETPKITECEIYELKFN